MKNGMNSRWDDEDNYDDGDGSDVKCNDGA